MNVVKLRGCHLSAKAGSFKRAQYSGRAKSQNSSCRKHLKNPLWNIHNENYKSGLWIAVDGRPVPRSACLPPCMSASGTKSKGWIVVGEKRRVF